MHSKCLMEISFLLAFEIFHFRIFRKLLLGESCMSTSYLEILKKNNKVLSSQIIHTRGRSWLGVTFFFVNSCCTRYCIKFGIEIKQKSWLLKIGSPEYFKYTRYWPRKTNGAPFKSKTIWPGTIPQKVTLKILRLCNIKGWYEMHKCPKSAVLAPKGKFWGYVSSGLEHGNTSGTLH